MISTPKIVIISPDKTLSTEVEKALGAISDLRAVTHSASEVREGVELCRNRQPELVILELSDSTSNLRIIVDDILTVSPHTSVVAALPHGQTMASFENSSFFISAVRSGVRDFLRRPISTSDLDQFLDREIRRGPTQAETQGKVVTFFTNKGGVGKSTLSMNTAALLAQHAPGRVLIVDASIQMGVCSAMLDVRPKTSITDIVREKDRLDPTLIRELSITHESGLHLLASPHNALEATLIDDEVMSRVLNLARRTFDYVIVDTFPMIDKVMMAVLDQCDQAYLVTESTVPTLEGTARMLEVLEELGFPNERKKLVLNRYSSFVGNINAEEVTKRMGFEIDHIVPYEKKVLIAANIGKPFVLQGQFRSKFKKSIEKISDEIIALPTRVFGTRQDLRKSYAANGLQVNDT